MKKNSMAIKTTILAGLGAMILCGNAFAANWHHYYNSNGGSWQQDANGWWFQLTDGGYAADEWREIMGENGSWNWYYFDENGYMAADRWVGDYYVGADGALLKNTITPDGYQVGADGKWFGAAVKSTGVGTEKEYAKYWQEYKKNGVGCVSKPGYEFYFMSFNLNLDGRNLIDHGDYYELPGQNIHIGSKNDVWEDGAPFDSVELYSGSAFIRKNAVVTKLFSGSKVTFDEYCGSSGNSWPICVDAMDADGFVTSIKEVYIP